MNTTEKLMFYQDARIIRDLDELTIDLILKADGVAVDTASVERCKEAIIKYQYLDDDDSWEWQVDHARVVKDIRARTRT